MQFVIIAEHSPELCPMSNAKIRDLMKESATEIPSLAEKLGVNIITTNVFGPRPCDPYGRRGRQHRGRPRVRHAESPRPVEQNSDSRNLAIGGGYAQS